jgi:hypothetical protein
MLAFMYRMLEALQGFFGWLLGKPPFLCDTCKYNYGDVCHRPERPNATRCPDYKRR